LAGSDIKVQDNLMWYKGAVKMKVVMINDCASVGHTFIKYLRRVSAAD